MVKFELEILPYSFKPTRSIHNIQARQTFVTHMTEFRQIDPHLTTFNFIYSPLKGDRTLLIISFVYTAVAEGYTKGIGYSSLKMV